MRRAHARRRSVFQLGRAPDLGTASSLARSHAWERRLQAKRAAAGQAARGKRAQAQRCLVVARWPGTTRPEGELASPRRRRGRPDTTRGAGHRAPQGRPVGACLWGAGGLYLGIGCDGCDPNSYFAVCTHNREHRSGTTPPPGSGRPWARTRQRRHDPPPPPPGPHHHHRGGGWGGSHGRDVGETPRETGLHTAHPPDVDLWPRNGKRTRVARGRH